MDFTEHINSAYGVAIAEACAVAVSVSSAEGSFCDAAVTANAIIV